MIDAIARARRTDPDARFRLDLPNGTLEIIWSDEEPQVIELLSEGNLDPEMDHGNDLPQP